MPLTRQSGAFTEHHASRKTVYVDRNVHWAGAEPISFMSISLGTLRSVRHAAAGITQPIPTGRNAGSGRIPSRPRKAPRTATLPRVDAEVSGMRQCRPGRPKGHECVRGRRGTALPNSP